MSKALSSRPENQRFRRGGVGRHGLWREVGWILGKDLRAERRAPTVMVVSLLQATLVVAACALAGDMAGRGELACAAIWVSVAFAGVHAASSAFAREQASGVLLLLRTGPIRGVSLFLGKATTVGLMTLVGGLAATGLTALLIDSTGLGAWPWRLLGILVAGSFGFSIAGALVAPLLGLGAGREALLALVLLPLGVPIIVSGARATAALYSSPAALDVYRDSLGIVLGLDAVFLALALWLFEPLIRRRG